MNSQSKEISTIPISYPGNPPIYVLPLMFLFKIVQKTSNKLNSKRFSTLLHVMWRKISSMNLPEEFKAMSFPSPPLVELTKDKSYHISTVNTLALELFDDISEEAERLISTIDIDKKLQEQVNAKSGKYFKIQLNKNMYANPPDSVFTKYALQPKLINIAKHYLGVIPRLHSTELHLDCPVEGDPISSQYWHYDGTDLKLIKVFTYLRDVTKETGCLALIDTPHSLKWKSHLSRAPEFSKRDNRRIEFIEKNIPSSAILSMHGPKGTLIFADTSKNLHRGIPQETKPRLMFVATYSSCLPLEEWPLSPYKADYLKQYKELGLI